MWAFGEQRSNGSSRWRLLLSIGLGVTTLTVGLAAPDAARAATTFKGTTEQGRGITVEVGDDGLVSKVRIKWKAKCHPGFVRGKTVHTAPLDESTANGFADKDSDRDRFKGIRARLKSNVSGEKVSETGWEGTFKEKVRLSDRGHTLARCKTGETGWSATSVSEVGA